MSLVAAARPRIKSTNGRLGPLRLQVLRLGLRWTECLSQDLAARWSERLFTTPRHFKPPFRELEALRSGLPYVLKYRDGRRRHSLQTWKFGQGPMILLAHGWSGRGAQLYAFIAPLVAAGFSVLVFDQPAHGRSAGKRVSLVDFARAMIEIDRQLGPLQAVIAHSMGGAAAALAVRQGLSIERLVVIGAPASVEGALANFARIARVGEGVLRAMQRRLERHYDTPLEDLDLRRRPHAVPGPFDETAPTALLAIHDRGDREVPFADSEALVAAWPQARLVATESLGHKRILRDPGVVTAAVAFVTAADGQRTAARAAKASALSAWKQRAIARTAEWAQGLVEQRG